MDDSGSVLGEDGSGAALTAFSLGARAISHPFSLIFACNFLHILDHFRVKNGGPALNASAYKYEPGKPQIVVVAICIKIFEFCINKSDSFCIKNDDLHANVKEVDSVASIGQYVGAAAARQMFVAPGSVASIIGIVASGQLDRSRFFP